MLIDATVLDTQGKDVSLGMLELHNMITQGLDVRAVKTYTAWGDIGVSGTPTAKELYAALPNNSQAILPLTSGNTVLGLKVFNTPSGGYSPAILVAIKSDNNRLSLTLYTEHYVSRRMVYSNGSNDTGWGALVPTWTTIPVPSDLTDINQINVDGEYYVPSAIAAKMVTASAHPYGGDQIIQRRSSHFGGSQKYWYIQGAAASNVLLFKSPFAVTWKSL